MNLFSYSLLTFFSISNSCSIFYLISRAFLLSPSRIISSSVTALLALMLLSTIFSFTSFIYLFIQTLGVEHVVVVLVAHALVIELMLLLVELVVLVLASPVVLWREVHFVESAEHFVINSVSYLNNNKLRN